MSTCEKGFNEIRKNLFVILGVLSICFVLILYGGTSAFSSSSDTDEDGLTNYEEAIFGTDPYGPDTDSDTVDDLNDVFPLNDEYDQEPSRSEVRLTWSGTFPYQGKPSVWGDRIVYEDSRNGNYDIYMFSLSPWGETRITTNSENQRYPHICGDRIVWLDNRGGTDFWDVYVYDIVSKTETNIGHAGNYFGSRPYPRISGDRIVWYRSTSYTAQWEVVLYDLNTETETVIASFSRTYSSPNPDISGDRIVWDQNNYIYLYEIDAATTTVITPTAPTTGKSRSNPRISGNYVVWEEITFPGSNGELYVYDISLSTTNIIAGGIYYCLPNISGNRIAYLDYDDDVQLYEIGVGSIGQINQSPAPCNDPAIFRNRVAWQRDGDIYVSVENVPLDVSMAGTGSGTVTSVPAGINCGSDCNEIYGYGTVVTLKATPASGSYFGGWSGGCESLALTCKVRTDDARNVTATFISGTPSVITWAKRYGGSGRSIQQTSDGGFIVADRDQDVRVLKLGADSSKEWEKSYAIPGKIITSTESLQQTQDGGYIITGQSQAPTEYWILKLRDDGSVQWFVKFGGSVFDQPLSITETSDGGFIVAGITYINQVTGDIDIWVVKLRGDGSIEWNNTYGSVGGETFGASIKETSGEGYILATSSNLLGAGSWDAWILKLNPDGSIAWQNAYGGTATDTAYSVQETSDGGYIISGTKTVASSLDAWILKLSGSGTISWSKTYGGTGTERAYSARETPDGGYIIVATTDSFGAGDDDIWVIKVDSSGNLLWDKTYGTAQEEQAFSIDETADGGFAVAGTWALKTDTQGDIDGCPAGLIGAGGVGVVVNDVTGAITKTTTNMPAQVRSSFVPTYVTPTVTDVILPETEICTGSTNIYIVTATVAGVGGSVDPTFQTVNAGETTTVTVTPDIGYLIGLVSVEDHVKSPL